ncbi:hypothetical protein [Streptomyces sp. Go-475]|uniref:hypothetical protein n=1 Tax=Streptomyces sp. Go-475 TaxID=2072505 RepID=UPI000DF061B6|nr:hypothetical protein C1703_00265 [Streptomyces sp. Go-475]
MAITDGMTERGLLSWESGPALTVSDGAWLTSLGVAGEGVGVGEARRPHVRTCLDWTEGRLHLAGAVAAAVFHRALEARPGWCTAMVHASSG